MMNYDNQRYGMHTISISVKDCQKYIYLKYISIYINTLIPRYGNIDIYLDNCSLKKSRREDTPYG